MNVKSVGKPLVTSNTFENMPEHTLGGNPMNIRSAGKSSVTSNTFKHVWEYTLGKTPMNVNSVGKLSDVSTTLIDSWEHPVERNPINVQCEKAFTSHYALPKHMRIHTGEITYGSIDLSPGNKARFLSALDGLQWCFSGPVHAACIAVFCLDLVVWGWGDFRSQVVCKAIGPLGTWERKWSKDSCSNFPERNLVAKQFQLCQSGLCSQVTVIQQSIWPLFTGTGCTNKAHHSCTCHGMEGVDHNLSGILPVEKNSTLTFFIEVMPFQIRTKKLLTSNLLYTLLTLLRTGGWFPYEVMVHLYPVLFGVWLWSCVEMPSERPVVEYEGTRVMCAITGGPIICRGARKHRIALNSLLYWGHRANVTAFRGRRYQETTRQRDEEGIFEQGARGCLLKIGCGITQSRGTSVWFEEVCVGQT